METTSAIRAAGGRVYVFPDLPPKVERDVLLGLAKAVDCAVAYKAFCNDKPCLGMCRVLTDLPKEAVEAFVIL